ncbi:MAG: glycosyltransferase, partial [Flavobacterium sp.]|nr:glycosyltransferase [Flavobacterium sp.]
MSKVVTLIMPVFNQLPYTIQAIESLQKFTDKESYNLIIIDNASTDGTDSYLKMISNAYDNIIVVTNKENLGCAKAFNIGHNIILKKEEKPEFILWINNDILFEDNWLQKMLKRFENSSVGMVGPTSDFTSGLQNIQYNIQGLKTEETKFLIGFFQMMRTSLVEQIGEIEESYGMGGAEEIDYCIRARKVGWKFLIARDIFIKHFGSKTLQTLFGETIEKMNAYHLSIHQKLVDKWGEELITELYTVDKERLRIGFGLPLRTNYVHRLFFSSAVMLLKPGKWDLIDAPRQQVADARNLIVKKALELGCTH